MGESQDLKPDLFRLRRQGRYRDVVLRSHGYSSEELLVSGAILELTHAQVLQGAFADAQKTCKEALADDSALPAQTASALKLRRALLAVFCHGDFDGALRHVEAVASDSEFAKARKIMARAQVAVLASVYQQAPEPIRSIHDQLEEASERFEALGAFEDAVLSYIYLGQCMRPGVLGYTGDGRNWFETAARRAQEWRLPHRQGEALLTLADLLYQHPTTREEAAGLFEQAAEVFRQADHAHGPWDVRRYVALNRLRLGEDVTESLEACRQAYEGQDFFRGLHSVFSSWGTWCIRCGDLAQGRVRFTAAAQVSRRMGSKLAEVGARLSELDAYSWGGEHSKAIQGFEGLLADDLPVLVRNHVRVLLANARLTMADPRGAAQLHRAAIRDLDDLGDVRGGSLAAMNLANTLSSLGRLEDAERLLLARLESDRQRGHHLEVANQLKLLGDLEIQRAQSRGEAGVEAHCRRASEWLRQASELVPRIPPPEDRRLVAEVHQAWARINLLIGPVDEGLDHIHKALEGYRRLGYRMHVANGRCIEGLLNYKLATESSSLHHFDSAGQAFAESLQAFEASGLHAQAQQGRHLLAQALVRGAALGPESDRPPRLEACFALLETYEREAVRSRLSLVLRDAAATQEARVRLLADDEKVYRFAVDLCASLLGDSGLALDWEERRKSRALVDAMAQTPLPAFDRAIPEEAVAQERALARRIRFSATDREALEATEALEALYQRLEKQLGRNDYLDLRQGRPADWRQVRALLDPLPENQRRVVVAEYAYASQGFRLIFLTPESPSPKHVEIHLDAPRLARFVQMAWETPGGIRLRFRKARPADLHQFDVLVAPLAQISRPGDVIYLVPCGLLHHLPLHALRIDGGPLIERNPVVYAPSATVLRYCLARRGGARETRDPVMDSRKATVFGTEDPDSSANADFARRVARRLKSRPVLGAAVTREHLLSALLDSDLVHLQGHASFDAADPLASGLHLSGGQRLTARDLFQLTGARTRLMSLGACDTGAYHVAAGDELLGLPRALLYAGVPTLLATLWPVHRESTSFFMERFYDHFLDDSSPGDRRVTKADALRRAMLETRAEKTQWATPYHWAPFVLIGDWR